MSSELEQTRAHLATLEKRYLNLCDEVRRRALRIMSKDSNDKPHEAGHLAIALADHACDAKQAYLMQQKQTAGYDQAALRVNAAALSNREIGRKRED